MQSPLRLCDANVHRLPRSVAVPGYQRRRGGPRIVHIGVGNFHRAHQAVYLDDLLHHPDCPSWEISGVGLLPRDRAMHEALTPQDCLYTVVEASGDECRARVVGSLAEHLYASEDREAAISRMAAPECHIVSLTVTEGGYRGNHGPADWPAYLCEALDRRRASGLPPFTVLSCDNLQKNGDAARGAVAAFARRQGPALADWLVHNGAFPNSMVDRITPETTTEHRRMVADEFGILDAWPVMTEPFRQWIIEDRFACGRPEWERAGALMTSDVLPYEKIKIRLLNAGHQALCYPGMLLGYDYVHEAVADTHIARFLRVLMDREVSPLLPAVPGIDLAEYKPTLVRRFGNTAIRDRLSRIAVDSSSRMREHLLPSLAEQLQRGGPIRMLTLAVAGWFRWLAGAAEVSDPLAARLTECARRGGADPGALLGIREIFGDALPTVQRFRDELGRALRSLYEIGPRATLAVYQQQ